MPQPFYGGGIQIKLFKAVKLQHQRNAHFGYMLTTSGWFKDDKQCINTLRIKMQAMSLQGKLS